MPQVLQFPKRQTLRDLLEPSREQDEALLRVIAAYEAEGGQVLFSGESSEEGEVQNVTGAGHAVAEVASSPTSPNNFVSEYLTRPLRTEEEARAQLNCPRIPQAKGLAQLIAEQTGLDRTFAKLFGG